MPLSPKAAAALQVGGGIAVVLVVYALSLWLLQNDQLVVDPSDLRPPKSSAKILDGYASTSQVANKSWSTVNQDAFSSVALRRSFNRKGGAQFSYSIWLNIRDTSAANVAGRTLFMRGDARSYTWIKEPTPGAAGGAGGAGGAPATMNGVLIACPRVSFGPTFDSLAVQVNTVSEPVVVFNTTPVAAEGVDPATGQALDTSLRHNALKLMQAKWALLTFVFEDHVAISAFEDGLSARFYLNDVLYASWTAPSALKQNNGDFFLLPAFDSETELRPIKDAMVGDATYYNYALSTEDAARIFQQGPPRHPAKDLSSGGMGEPLYLSEYNKLDIYNT